MSTEKVVTTRRHKYDHNSHPATDFSKQFAETLFELSEEVPESVKQQKVPIPPRPKLLVSLRNNTLSNEEAVADLLDNTLDWDTNANNVWMYKSPQRFIMADDGAGMSKATLIDALKLGS